MAQTDAKLVAMVKTGDDRAFDLLVSRHRSAVYALARGRVACRDAALDLAQEAFVQAYVCIGNLRDGQAFGAWVRGIAANLCRMHLRRLREVPTDDRLLRDLVERAAPPATDLTSLHDAMASLPPGARSAAHLRFVDGLALSELAQKLGISLAAAKSRIREARLTLREELTDMANRSTSPDRPGKEFNRDLRERLALARWYREFSDLISSGESLVASLHHLAAGSYPDPIRRATVKLAEAVEGGQTLSGALQDQPALRTPQAVGMVRMGEVGGILDWTARFLADRLDVENSRRDLEVAFWCGSLGSIVQAGVPIQMAVETSLCVVPDDAIGAVVTGMAQAIESGEPVAGVLEQASSAVPALVVACALAGEAADCLAWSLRLAASELNLRVAARLASGGFLSPAPSTASAIAQPWSLDALGGTGPFGRPTEPVLRAFAAALRGMMLEHETAALRAAAAHLLGRLADAGSAPACEQAVTDDDPSVRIAAVGALAVLAPQLATPAAVGLLDDRDSSVRQAAVEALEEAGDRAYAEPIARRMGDPDQRVADTALRVLGKWGLEKLIVRTAAGLLCHKSSAIRWRAAAVLEHRSDPEAADALVTRLTDETPFIRVVAACALARVGRQEGIPVLVETVECPWSGIVRRGAEALALVGDASHAPCVRRALAEGRLHESYTWIAERLEARAGRQTG